jgi:hypothetical protein
MERFFTNALLQEYIGRLGPLNYTLMNHEQFYAWWSDSSVPALTRQVSYDIAMKTCTGLGEKYSMDAINGVKFDNRYDILVSVNEQMPATTQEEKRMAISGFLITRLGECKLLPDLYSIHLICVHPGGISGKILIGAFLYCLKRARSKKGILELAGGYENIPAYFAYSKMGFQKDLGLYGENCFTDLDVLPMSVNAEALSDEEIIGYSKGTMKRVVQDDTRLFETGVPETPRQEELQVEMASLAQRYYVRQLAELYNEHGEFEVTESLFDIKRMLDKLFKKYKCNDKCTVSGGKRNTRRKRSRKRSRGKH